ncbi:Glu/Leu/Phe/Val dehydrogenase dimerization domain-containing protein [Rhizobium freirei]|nr:Glu/Leu/Phe/Val dehydrogenase dimerization domain-containing protein [Rhizobium freirei]
MFISHPAFDQHKLVTARYDRASKLNAIIAVHNDNRGPAIGGCRIYPYGSSEDALRDVLRLSRGMSYKTAIADIPYGGGKAVIIADPEREKSPALLQAMGEFVESLAGLYITSFDSGTTLDDVRTIATATSFAAGISEEAFDASESTADGVFACLKAAAAHGLGTDKLSGVTVAVQGVGSVGRRLVRRLHEAGARIILSDINRTSAEQVAAEYHCEIAEPGEIHRVEADIFSPNALGGGLNSRTIPEIRARTVVGGANNQLETSADDLALKHYGILYCPDYLANAGGIINLHYQLSNWDQDALGKHIDRLAETFMEIMERAKTLRLPNGEVADRIAEERFSALGAGR